MLGVDLWIHWLHLMAAILWVGSVLFAALVVQPVLRRCLEPEARLAVYREIGRRFTPLQWGAWAVLLATGLAKLRGLRATPDVFYGPFGRILAVKLALVGVMAVLSLLHTYRWGPRLIEAGPGHPEYPRMVSRMALWGKVNLLLLSLIVFCAALLRYNPW